MSDYAIWYELTEKYASHKSVLDALAAVRVLCVQHRPWMINAEIGIPAPIDTDWRQFATYLDETDPAELGNLRRYFFARIIDWGNEAGLWRIPVIPFDVALPWPESPFTPRAIQRLGWWRYFEEALVHNIERFAHAEPLDRFAMVVASAVLLGGIVERTSLDFFAKNTPQCVQFEGAYSFFDVPAEEYEPPARGITRRALDPLTTLLVLRLRDFCTDRDEPLPNERSFEQLWPPIRAMLERQGNVEMILPSTAAEFVDGAADALRFRVEPVLANFATGALKSFALPRKTEVHPGAPAIADADGVSSDSPFAELERIFTSRAAGKPNWNNEAVDALIRIGGGVNGNRSIPFAMATFISRTLCDAATKNRVETLQALRNSWRNTYRPLLFEFGDTLVESLAETGYIRVYDQILNHTPHSGQRRRTLLDLRRFHKHLIHRHGAPIPPLAHLRSIPLPKRRVKVGLITPAVFDETLELIRIDRRHLAYGSQLDLIAILCYRLGCRFAEAWKLRICDVVDAFTPYIRIRSYADRKTKSVTGVRLLPMRGFLTEDEIRALLAHRIARLAATEGDIYALLFSQPNCRSKPIPKKVVSKVITNALRVASSSPNATIHTLRHAIPSYLYVSALAYRHTDNPSAIVGCPALPFRSEIESAVTSLYRTKDANAALSMPTLTHAFAQMMGHLHSKTMLEDYTHTLHWAMACALAYKAPGSLPASTVAALMNVSTATAYRLITRHKADEDTLPLLSWMVRKCLLSTNTDHF